MIAKDVQKTVSRVFAKSKKAVAGLTGQRRVEAAEETVIVKAGDVAAECYLVVSGYVAEHSEASVVDGDVVRIVTPGGFLGLDGLFAGKRAVHTRTYTAASPVVVLALSRRELEVLACRDEAVLADLFRLQSALAEERTLRGCLLRGNNGSEQLSSLLEHFGWNGRPPVKWKVIARYLGMNVCAFSRSLARLRKSGRL